MTLAQDARDAVAAYAAHQQRIADLSAALIASNDAIRVVKEQAATANVEAIATDFSLLRATRARHTPRSHPFATTTWLRKPPRPRARKSETERGPS